MTHANLATWFYTCPVCNEEVSAGALLPHGNRHIDQGEPRPDYQFSHVEEESVPVDEIQDRIAARTAEDSKGNSRRKVVRSSKTGQFVPEREAEAHPDTTVTETIEVSHDEK